MATTVSVAQRGGSTSDKQAAMVAFEKNKNHPNVVGRASELRRLLDAYFKSPSSLQEDQEKLVLSFLSQFAPKTLSDPDRKSYGPSTLKQVDQSRQRKQSSAEFSYAGSRGNGATIFTKVETVKKPVFVMRDLTREKSIDRARRITDRFKKVNHAKGFWWTNLSVAISPKYNTIYVKVDGLPKGLLQDNVLVTADPNFAKQEATSDRKLAQQIIRAIYTTFDSNRGAKASRFRASDEDVRVEAAQIRMEADVLAESNATEAEVAYKRALEVDSKYAAGYVAYAEFLASEKKIDESVKLLSEALEFHGDEMDPTECDLIKDALDRIKSQAFVMLLQ